MKICKGADKYPKEWCTFEGKLCYHYTPHEFEEGECDSYQCHTDHAEWQNRGGIPRGMPPCYRRIGHCLDQFVHLMKEAIK